MAYGVDFTGTNITFGPPAGRDDVASINAFRNSGSVVTCWQLSEEELDEVKRTGKVFLSVLYGGALVPVFVGSSETVRDLVADYGGTFPKQETPECPS